MDNVWMEPEDFFAGRDAREVAAERQGRTLMQEAFDEIERLRGAESQHAIEIDTLRSALTDVADMLRLGVHTDERGLIRYHSIAEELRYVAEIINEALDA